MTCWIDVCMYVVVDVDNLCKERKGSDMRGGGGGQITLPENLDHFHLSLVRRLPLLFSLETSRLCGTLTYSPSGFQGKEQRI
jgi:hypothetical protein